MNAHICILCVGKIKEEYYRSLCQELSEELRKQSDFQILEVKDESIPENCSERQADQIKKKEAERLLASINPKDAVCALCIEGKPLDRNGLKRLIQKEAEASRRFCFVIGGSLGLHDTVIARANYRISFSNMTFPHQLMRVILAEQLRDVIYDR